MKTPVCLLALVIAASGAAATTVRKPAPAKPAPVRPAPAKVQPEAVPVAKIEAAVRAAVTAHFKARGSTGSSGSGISGVSLAVEDTAPIAGWSGRYRTNGTATLRISGVGIGPADQKQSRRFEALTEVAANGAVTVVDVSVR